MSEDVKEISFEELGLTKALDKMTAKELRALCMAKLPMITGASSKSKDELVETIKDLFGMNDEDGKVSPYKDQIFSIKRQIRELRVKKESITERADREYLRRKINKLKKRTRRLANAV
ncbi:hypothetical protein [Pseudodesulfovibrio senegalensis]|jgi:polyhydroxyalkanoate synthesis regulator phasin|uniref:Rho termination factor N-terminal domain-containing protein n=1 Tax=Pseudodesulfovibrio senegalensis TaxID=1721087 RepID=A0A6N6N4D3_9BACT|nr:hypothetical protein [Pseudodesulfovibrio senegalensis]KAB1442064.1 hypothetical protein F8A88_06250 [Pseudodesulfovibrio senegalensis]